MAQPSQSAEHPGERPVAAPPELDSEGRPVQDENGVDLTQIREMLALTPLERLQQAEAWMRDLDLVRRATHPADDE